MLQRSPGPAVVQLGSVRMPSGVTSPVTLDPAVVLGQLQRKEDVNCVLPSCVQVSDEIQTLGS